MLNNISIVGRVTKDIKLTTTANKKTFTKFNVAVPSDQKRTSAEKETDFFVCIAWQETAENIAKYFKKGSLIGLVGSMNCRYYEADGKKTPMWELNVRSFSFISSKDEEGNKKSSNNDVVPIDDDDCPF